MKTEAAWIKEAEMALPLDPKLTPALIRAIQIDAPREARELVMADTPHQHLRLYQLDKLIRELELK